MTHERQAAEEPTRAIGTWLCWQRVGSEAPRAVSQGFEPPMAKRTDESPADTEVLMEEGCERENCQQALRRGSRRTRVARAWMG